VGFFAWQPLMHQRTDRELRTMQIEQFDQNNVLVGDAVGVVGVGLLQRRRQPRHVVVVGRQQQPRHVVVAASLRSGSDEGPLLAEVVVVVVVVEQQQQRTHAFVCSGRLASGKEV
jgi:hypothetical protein